MLLARLMLGVNDFRLPDAGLPCSAYNVRHGLRRAGDDVFDVSRLEEVDRVWALGQPAHFDEGRVPLAPSLTAEKNLRC